MTLNIVLPFIVWNVAKTNNSINGQRAWSSKKWRTLERRLSSAWRRLYLQWKGSFGPLQPIMTQIKHCTKPMRMVINSRSHTKSSIVKMLHHCMSYASDLSVAFFPLSCIYECWPNSTCGLHRICDPIFSEKMHVAVVLHATKCSQRLSDLQVTKDFQVPYGQCSWRSLTNEGTMNGRRTDEFGSAATDFGPCAHSYRILYP